MRKLGTLFQQNRRWAQDRLEAQPDFFQKLSAQQSPKYLWIGCSDSRVPANEIVGLAPGELFVHRNVANVVVHTDMNCLSVLQYAVEMLRVEHVIVCGHYGCGGIKAALGNVQYGLLDNWLRNIKDLYQHRKDEIESLGSLEEKVNKMCELNVRAQVFNVCHTTIVQNAWKRGQPLAVHGWIYAIGDGLLHDLGVTIEDLEELDRIYRVG